MCASCSFSYLYSFSWYSSQAILVVVGIMSRYFRCTAQTAVSIATSDHINTINLFSALLRYFTATNVKWCAVRPRSPLSPNKVVLGLPSLANRISILMEQH